ncbi:MAG: hypothetical protein WDZ93_02125 [Candidatus Paceibacterota bacterium]
MSGGRFVATSESFFCDNITSDKHLSSKYLVVSFFFSLDHALGNERREGFVWEVVVELTSRTRERACDRTSVVRLAMYFDDESQTIARGAGYL